MLLWKFSCQLITIILSSLKAEAVAQIRLAQLDIMVFGDIGMDPFVYFVVSGRNASGI